MPLLEEQATPWYRRLAALLPDTIPIRCFFCLLFFGVFFTLVGVIMTGTSYTGPPRTFRPPSVAKQRELETIRIVGPVILATGLAIITFSLLLRCRLPAWRLWKDKMNIKEDSNHTQPEFVMMNQMQEAQFMPVDIETSRDSPSTSTHSEDTRKKLADKMLY